MDMVPGSVTYLWFEPTRAGTFDIMCFELCGTGHYGMRGSLVVQGQEEFEEWLEEQSTFAESLALNEPISDQKVVTNGYNLDRDSITFFK